MIDSMAAEPIEIRMARLEGAYEQISERLGVMERLLSGLSVEIRDLRGQTSTQFYWLLTLILGSILIPILRDIVP